MTTKKTAKKVTATSTKSAKPAPAKTETSAKSASAVKNVEKKTEKVIKPAIVEKVSIEKPKADTKKTQEKTKISSSSGVTKITAMVDVGWGNSLFLRGDGPGLSWDKGVLMTCNSSNAWHWETSSAKANFHVKFLINDDHWSVNDNLEVKAGKAQTVVPEFFG